MTAHRLLSLALGLGLFVALAGTAQAQTPRTPGQQTFYDLQGAIVAYERCYRPLDPATNTAQFSGRTFRFTQAQYSQLTERLLTLVNENITAGQSLELLQAAKMRMSMRVSTRGCADSGVQAALDLYNAQLASAVTM